jgi:DNA (cytosine-5)-methyltransferase 1
MERMAEVANDNAPANAGAGEPLRFLSVCSGIEAASVAWKPLGWQCIGVAEIEPFPAFVLAHHYGAGRPKFMPDPEEEGIDGKTRRDRMANIRAMSKLPTDAPLTNWGDFTKIDPAQLGRVDILCGGTPCQAFSVAGLRQSLADARGNLSLEFVRLAHELADRNGLRNVVWENVVGVLSTKDNAFGCFLAGLVGADSAIEPTSRGKWAGAGMVAGPKGRAAWRVLDAQYFGVAQRRRRVIVVADFGNGADPAEILFELDGVQRHTAPSREARKDVAPTISARTKGGGGLGADFDLDGGLVEYAIQAGALRENPDSGPDGVGVQERIAYTLEARAEVQAVAWSIMPQNSGKDYKARQVEVAQPLMAGGPVGGNQGGDYIQQPVAYAPEIARCVATREGSSQDYETTTMVAVDIAPTMRAGGNSTGGDRPYGTDVDTCDSLVSYRIAGDGAAYEEGDCTAPLTTGTDPSANIVAFDTTQITSKANRSNPQAGDPCHPLAAGAHAPAVAFQSSQSGVRLDEVHATLDSNNGSRRHNGALQGSAVRRLTPVECERLQGFPDNYTNTPWRGKPTSPDGPRYKALGNSWAVPKFTWLGRRIARFMPKQQEAKRAA